MKVEDELEQAKIQLSSQFPMCTRLIEKTLNCEYINMRDKTFSQPITFELKVAPAVRCKDLKEETTYAFPFFSVLS